MNQQQMMRYRRIWSEWDEEDYRYDDRRIFHRSAANASALEVSKFVQYVIMYPPDTSVSVSKFVQYVVLYPPEDSVSISKIVQYVAFTDFVGPARPHNTAYITKPKFRNTAAKLNSLRARRLTSSLSVPAAQIFVIT